MTHAPIRNICAAAAICAVLALGSNPAWAQDAAPPLDASAPPRAHATASDDDWPTSRTTGFVALLAALGLGAGACLVTRAGRRREDEYEAEPAPTYAEPPSLAMAGSEELAPAEPSIMPQGPIPVTREQRDALLEEMVSAPPDADNPFTSRKARMRRARIILQAREHQQQEEAAQPLDLRTYRPLASNPAPATPPRVTV